MSKPSLVNPFASPAPGPSAEPQVRWGIAASGPPVDTAEVETAQRAAEVVLMWGDEVLHVTHVSPPRDVIIGEGGGDVAPDYLIGRDVLGAERLPIVVERDGQLCCVIPEGASGEITLGEATRSFAALEAEGKLAAFDGLAGAKLYVLPEGAAARVEHRGLAFLVKPTSAGRAVGAKTGLKLKHTGWIGLSLSVHAVFLVLFYFMPPHSQALSLNDTHANERMIAYLENADALVEEPLPEFAAADPGEPGEEGARHDGEEGQAGTPDERPNRNRMATERTSDADPVMARQNIRENMDSVAAIGALRAMTGTWSAPTSPYGADVANGIDAMNALGALMGDQVGDNFGIGGLSMRGTGIGGGGLAQGTYGVGRLGTMGTCRGEACGPGNGPGGYGDGVDLRPGRHNARVPPPVTYGRAQVTGGLSQEAIRRVVQRHLPEVRFCYEQGLQSNPGLEGRVSVRWIISPAGGVQSAAIGSSDLRNGAVESCIASAVQRWTFPAPDGGGMVGVNYPFVLRSSN